MKKKLFRFCYIIFILALLYLPLLLVFKNIKFSSLFSDNELIICIINTLIISVISALIVSLLSYYISKYLLLYKRNYNPLFVFPLLIGVLVYFFNINTSISPYILVLFGYISLLTPMISYLELEYLKKITETKKSLIKSFGKIEFLKLLNEQIIIYYFISFIVVYSDYFISSFIFNSDTKLLSLYLVKMIRENNYSNVGNALFLSFIIIFIIALILYMIAYERRLRGKYEKDY